MAKLIGQFTTPRFDANNNKTHEAFLHAVVFVFTSGTTKITRETDAKGKYSFDLANGEYEVSVYLKGNTEKDRFDMRAGEKFVVTATTTADALEKWLQVIGSGGKDELATYYENLLAQMQKVANDFKKDTEFVGSGKFMKEGAYGIGGRALLVEGSGKKIRDVLGNKSGTFVNNAGDPCAIQNSAGIMLYHYQNFVTYLSIQFNNVKNIQASTEMGDAIRSVMLYNTGNTTIDSNGNLKAASPIIKLFSDHIESNDSFKEKPSLEKLGTGAYKISNTLGLAKEGWYIETPKDKNGLPYFMVDWEQDEESHDVIIRVFKKKLDIETLDFVNGDPVDIGQDQRWIDLRFHEEQEADDEELLTQLDNLDESAH